LRVAATKHVSNVSRRKPFKTSRLSLECNSYCRINPRACNKAFVIHVTSTESAAELHEFYTTAHRIYGGL
jgi:hypothetical protein